MLDLARAKADFSGPEPRSAAALPQCLVATRSNNGLSFKRSSPDQPRKAPSGEGSGTRALRAFHLLALSGPQELPAEAVAHLKEINRSK